MTPRAETHEPNPYLCPWFGNIDLDSRTDSPSLSPRPPSAGLASFLSTIALWAHSLPCSFDWVKTKDAYDRLLPSDSKTFTRSSCDPGPLFTAHAAGSALGGLGLKRLGRAIPRVHGPGKGFGTPTPARELRSQEEGTWAYWTQDVKGDAR